MALTYKDAGVDIEAGARLVADIAPLARGTMRPEVMGSLGGFAGLCGLPAGYDDPVLVSGTDGVGTKLKSAVATGRHRTVGVDLVAMAVNDVAVTGAEPLFFLDYFATATLEVDVAREVITGIADGCKQAGCALLGGETAELPGLYRPGDYDLAGFCVGVVERERIWDGRGIAAGDVLIGLPSSGLHSNGHSLARKVLLEHYDYGDAPAELRGASIADVLLAPTIIYVPALTALRQAGVAVKAAAHITGGGIVDNAPRMLTQVSGGDPRDNGRPLTLVFEQSTWDIPPVMTMIADLGQVAQAEMRRTFNMGIGMMIACSESEAERAMAAIAAAGGGASGGADGEPSFAPRIIGRVEQARDGHDDSGETVVRFV